MHCCNRQTANNAHGCNTKVERDADQTGFWRGVRNWRTLCIGLGWGPCITNGTIGAWITAEGSTLADYCVWVRSSEKIGTGTRNLCGSTTPSAHLTIENANRWIQPLIKQTFGSQPAISTHLQAIICNTNELVENEGFILEERASTIFIAISLLYRAYRV